MWLLCDRLHMTLVFILNHHQHQKYHTLFLLKNRQPLHSQTQYISWAIVRCSLAPSYLRHNSSTRWHDISLLTSRTSCICYRKTNELLKQKTLDVLFFFFFWFIHSFLYHGDVWLCEVTLWLAYWVLLSDCLAVITARNSHICLCCASNISLFTRHQASLPFKKCWP